MAIKKEKDKHLTDDLRLVPEAALRGRKSLSQIRRETGMPRSTIKRETVNRRVESAKTFYGRRFNPCVHRDECRATGLCGRPGCPRGCASCGIRCRGGSCPRFEEERRPRLAAAPYVCNGCPDEQRCRLRKFHYLHKIAHEGYRRALTESRQGVNPTEGGLRAINEVLVPALNRGQSPHHAMASAPEPFAVRERTLYNYVNGGALSVKRHSLPMAVRYKKRGGCPVEHKVDRRCTEGRAWEDCLAFVAANPGVQVPQADTVVGGRGDRRVLLTAMFPMTGFMVARLMPGKCAKHVADAFNGYTRRSGRTPSGSSSRPCSRTTAPSSPTPSRSRPPQTTERGGRRCPTRARTRRRTRRTSSATTSTSAASCSRARASTRSTRSAST